MFKYVLARLYAKYSFIKESNKMSSEDKARFDRMLSEQSDLTDVKSSLDMLMRMLYAHYDEIYNKEENLWSLLYMTGYLTKAGESERDNMLILKIPNREVASIFEDTVVNWFNDNIDRSKQSELVQAFWNGNETRATELLSQFLWKTISYHDYHEDYYHAFLAGLFTGIGYSIESN